MSAAPPPTSSPTTCRSYPELAENKQLLPIDDAVKKDNIDLAAYNEGLADLWVGQDGKRYGLPKDWDTVGLFYNKAMTRPAPASPRTR